MDSICSHVLKGLTPKDKISITTFRQTMATINDKILEKLFKQVSDDDEIDEDEYDT